MTRYSLLATTALTLLAAPVMAQQSFELDEIIVSGNLDATTLERIGVTASVVTREQLEESGETRAIDYLARIPGLDVRSRGPIGTLSSITIRGAGQNYVRVLVDGIDVSDTSGPQSAFDFGSLRTADIDRIEILRGGQSAIYGSEAIGGVINITTRRATEDGTQQFATFETGSYNTFSGSYGITRKDGDVDYAITLSAIETDGFSAADENDGNTEADGYSAQRLSFALGYDLSNGGRIGVNGFYETSRGEFDQQFPIQDGSPDEATNNVSQGLRAYAELPTGAIDSTFALTYYSIERRTEGSAGIFTANNLYEGTRFGVSYLGEVALGNGMDLRFGADYTRESYDQSGDYGLGNGESDITGIFAELAYAPSDMLDVVGTVRYDDHSQFGGFTTGRIAASYRPNEDWILRASAATSFRAPSLYELYGPFGTATLTPEESRSLDLSAEYRISDEDYVRATLFYNATDGLIDFPNPYANVPGTVTRQGVELEAGFALADNWRVDASYTYTEGENPTLTAGNSWNLEFPKHDISVTLSGDITDRISTALTIQHAADRPTLADYTLVNASFSYDVSDNVEAYLRIENLTNEEYQLRSSYGTSDRAFYVGLRAEF